jgi:hypothetical protein
MKRFFATIILLACGVCAANSDEFVPDFDAMKVLRCEFVETIYNQDGSVVSESDLFRIYSLEEEFKRLYLRREPIMDISYYGADKIEFRLQSMTDDYISLSDVIINRQTGEYTSKSTITYDNLIFGVRTAKAVGSCRALN